MIIVDTNVVSELMRPDPEPVVANWLRTQAREELYTTAITLAEIRYGLERLPEGRRKRLMQTTAEQVFVAFEQQVLPFDATAARHYALIASAREQAGAPIDGFDAQIASICRTYQAAVATRNLTDFHDTGIDIIDPWAQS